MKKFLPLLFILWASPAFATAHYFDNGSPDNTLPCTIGDPCDNFKGTTLDNAGALACGDTINLKRDEVWEGSEAEIEINTVGCSGNPITVQAYGSGANPVLAGASVTSGGWTNTSGAIWSQTGQSQTWLSSVTQTISGVTKGLSECESCTTTNLSAGTFKRSGTTLYVRLFADADPTTSNVRIGSFAHASGGDGSRGLLRDTDTVARAHYHDYRDITIRGANGVGFSLSGTGGRSLGLKIEGAGWDGWLCYHIEGSGGECADFADYYSEVSYSALLGAGRGQGITTYGGPFGAFIGTNTHDNTMAGMDLLDFAAETNVTEVVIMRVTSYNNSLSPDDPSYDGNLYVDGASEVFVYGLVAYGGGGVLNNARSGVAFSSEHPGLKPAANVYLVNSLIYGVHWETFNTGNSGVFMTASASTDFITSSSHGLSNDTAIFFPSNQQGGTLPGGVSAGITYYVINKTADTFQVSTSVGGAAVNLTSNTSWAYWGINNITGIHLINNTMLSLDSGSFDPVFSVGGMASTADTYKFRNNIFISDSAYVAAWMSSSSAIDMDENQYYKRGTAPTTTKIYSTNGGGTTYNLAEWRTLSGEDALSDYGDPLLTNNGDTPTVTLENGSPALDSGMLTPYTIPAWLPATVAADIGSAGFRGTTRASGALDDVTVAPDRGYHKDYAGLTSVSVTPTSLVQNTVTNQTVTFTLPVKVTALLYNWKVKVTFPSGFVLSSGSTSAMTSSNISGTWSACTISGQTITCPRAGDGNSEFPGTYSVVISNVRNPNTTGLTGTFDLETQDSSGTKIADSLGVSGVTISSGGSPVCGNSIVEEGETCDDGGTTGGDGCSAVCQIESPVCGNSIVESGEQCDDGGTSPGDGCSATCQIESPVCGNGIIESGETCDDNNTNAGDGCDASCQTEPGIGPHISCSGPITMSGSVTIS